MPVKAKVYIAVVSAAGMAAMLYALLHYPPSHDLLRLGTYFVLSILAATLKLRLPGLTGTMSVGFVLVLLGISELTLAESMLAACAGVIVQCLWRPKRRPEAVQILFSVSAVALSLTLAYQSAQFIRAQIHREPFIILLAITTCLYFLSNSLLVSIVLSLVKGEPLRVVWQQCYMIAFPYYLLGGAVAGLVAASNREFGWTPSLSILLVMGMVFLLYRFYLARFEMLPAAIASAAPLHAIETRSA